MRIFRSFLATRNSAPLSLPLRPIFHASATRIEYASIGSGCVVGTSSTASWFVVRASQSASFASSACRLRRRERLREIGDARRQRRNRQQPVGAGLPRRAPARTQAHRERDGQHTRTPSGGAGARTPLRRRGRCDRIGSTALFGRSAASPRQRRAATVSSPSSADRRRRRAPARPSRRAPAPASASRRRGCRLVEIDLRRRADRGFVRRRRNWASRPS